MAVRNTGPYCRAAGREVRTEVVQHLQRNVDIACATNAREGLSAHCIEYRMWTTSVGKQSLRCIITCRYESAGRGEQSWDF